MGKTGVGATLLMMALLSGCKSGDSSASTEGPEGGVGDGGLVTMMDMSSASQDGATSETADGAAMLVDGATTVADGSTPADDASPDCGCSIDLGVDMYVAPPALPIENVPNALAKLICERFAECLPVLPDTDTLYRVADGLHGSSCDTRVAHYFGEMTDALPIADVIAGRMAFDGVAAQTCIDDASRAGDCLSRADGVLRCMMGTFSGLIADGDACDYERNGIAAGCKPGSACAPSEISGCDDHCVAGAALGESCADGVFCAPLAGHSVSCEMRDGDSGPRCYATTSVLVGVGESCDETRPTAGEITHVNKRCQGGAICEHVGDHNECVAQPRAVLDASCESNLCQVDLWCDPNAGYKCRPFNIIATDGAMCGNLSDGYGFCDLAGGFGCVVPPESRDGIGVCKPLGTGREDNYCQFLSLEPNYFNIPLCGDGLYCNMQGNALGQVGVCKPLKTNGTVCERSDQCVSNYCGWPSTSLEPICTDKLALGADCAGSNESCESGYCANDDPDHPRDTHCAVVMCTM